MTPALTNFIGVAAGFMTTAAFVPQLIRVWTTRSAKDVSLGMLVMFVFGVMLWLVYGIMLKSWPVILANAVTLILAAAVLVLTVRYR